MKKWPPLERTPVLTSVCELEKSVNVNHLQLGLSLSLRQLCAKYDGIASFILKANFAAQLKSSYLNKYARMQQS
jgi:hypothetical protein